MTWWRSKRPQELAPEPAHRAAENESPVSIKDPVLSLQRSVGNRAVQKLMPKSHGEPIAEDDRKKLEGAFGHDLGDVRIHRDSEAGEFAEDVGANAFTTGRDIYFAPGAYGQTTLAHEVGHVIQQSRAPSTLAGEDAGLENQARAASSSFMSGDAAEMSPAAAAPAFQREPVPGVQSMKLLPTDSLTLDAFDIDKFDLSATHKQKLEAFAQRLIATLAAAPNSIVTIVGYADAPGTEPHNLDLGQRRADAVRNYLISLAVSPGQLHATSLGAGSPLIATKKYEAHNRRVEINVLERTFFKPAAPAQPGASPAPAPAPPTEKRKIDLTFHPNEHETTPGEELQDRMRLLDKAVREAQEAEKANQGTSVADVTGRVLRNAAKRLGLPKWLQDRAESLGKDLPSKGAQAAVDQLAGDQHLDAGARNALKALVDALMRTNVK